MANSSKRPLSLGVLLKIFHGSFCLRGKKGKERRDWTTEDEWNNQFALIVPSAFFSSSRRSKFVFVHHPTNHWKSFITGFILCSYIFVQFELTLNCWLFSIVQDRRAPTSAMTPMGHQACWTSGALTATTNARAPRTECEYWVWWLDVCMRSAWKVWRSRFRWKNNECEGRNSNQKNVKLRSFVRDVNNLIVFIAIWLRLMKNRENDKEEKRKSKVRSFCNAESFHRSYLRFW